MFSTKGGREAEKEKGGREREGGTSCNSNALINLIYDDICINFVSPQKWRLSRLCGETRGRRPGSEGRIRDEGKLPRAKMNGRKGGRGLRGREGGRL